MLMPVAVQPRRLAACAPFADSALLREIRALAAPLRGLRVAHVNATPDGGGVAEILRSLVPLSRDVGLDAVWYTLPPESTFFGVTKQFHNWLQGKPGRLTFGHQRTYTRYLEQLARRIDGTQADVWVIHDPQPLALRELVPLRGAVIWRCHIDCSTANPCVRDYLLPWVRTYDQALFSMPEYVLPNLSRKQVRIVYPAIDPLSPKNRTLSVRQTRAGLVGMGIDPRRPLLTQVSRFDPWKNPWQVIDIYRLAKRELPELQLAMAGVFAAKDDPEGPKIYRDIRRYAGRDPDVHLFTDPTLVGSREINALQSASNVVLQRSTREGFGLTVSEAMWKSRPVIATPVGGITVQVEHGKNGFLVRNTEESAELVVGLVREPRRARAIGTRGRRTVRQRFLLPRLLRDELRSYAELAGADAKGSLAA
jgi:trehalose synthase